MLGPMRRTLFIAFGALVLLGLVGAVTLSLWLGRIVQAGIERIGPQVIKATVTLERVDLSLLSGCATLKGLTIGNPPGYHAPRAIRVHRAQACIDRASLFRNPVVVTSVTLEQPEVTVEGVIGESNISAIQRHAQAFAASLPGAGARHGAPPDAAKDERRILIQEVRLTKGNATLYLKTGLLGEQTVEMRLPDIHLRDIGKDTGGAKPDELASAVLSSVFGAIKRSVGGG